MPRARTPADAVDFDFGLDNQFDLPNFPFAIMELPARYPYNPRWRVILACAMFFGAGSAFMAYKATHNTVGLIIDGIIRLGPAGATVFYWVISAFGAGFVFLAILLLARCIVSHKVLEVGTKTLLLPYGRFQRQTARIDYSAIQGFSEVKVSGQQFLYVNADGRRYTIAASLFPDHDSYQAVRDFLISRAPNQPPVPPR